jgi:hypothetical protein
VLAERREPIGSDRLAVHRSETPTGYSSAVVRQHSPLPLHRPPTLISHARCGAQSAARPPASGKPARHFTESTPRQPLRCRRGVICTLHDG